MVSKVYPIAGRVPHMLVVLAIALMLKGHAMEYSAQEKQKCVEQLTGISTCLPYVGGSAKAPTPDCCSGLVQAIKSNEKCICIIINDRNDPDLGLNINITLALGLPALCKAPGNFSLCPALLHLDPKSPEAQAFNQRNGSRSLSAQGNSQNGNSQSIDKTAIKQNDASYKGKRLLESLVTIAGLLIWFF